MSAKASAADGATILNTLAGTGLTVDSQHDDGATYFTNVSDGAQIHIEPFSSPESLASWQVRSDYVGFKDTMGRVRATKTFGEALEAVVEHVKEIDN